MLRRRPAPQVSRTRSALIGVVAALFLFPLLIPLPGLGNGLGVGDIAPRDLIARRDAQFESRTLTEAKRQQAAENAPVVRQFDPSVSEARTAEAEVLFNQVRTAVAQPGSIDERVAFLAQAEPASRLSEATQRALLNPELSGNPQRLDRLQAAVSTAIGDILDRSLTAADLPGAIQTYVASPVGAIPDVDPATLTNILTALAAETSIIDQQATDDGRARAAANVAPEILIYTEGQVVAPEGERLRPDTIEALRATGVIGDTVTRVTDLATGAIVALASGLTVAAFLYLFQPVRGAVKARLTIVGLAAFGVILASRLVIPTVLPDDEHFVVFAIPVATVAMLAATLLDLNFAVVTAVLVGVITPFVALTIPDVAGAQFGDPILGFEMATAYTASGLAGAAAVYGAERFGRFGFASLAVGGSTWVVLSCFWLLSENFERETFGWLTAASVVNGLAASIITVGAFVLLSGALGVTTRLKLMELGQTDHPLLARLQEEAPGTFQHSMIVGNLAERAARQIGADALTTRVGAYYHDIGKLAQPTYYVENQLDEDGTPHTQLSPRESAARIMEHVTNGVALARKHRLPQLIIDFIPQHHGTRLVTFFYRRAREDEDATVDPKDFRYDGPRPQTKEAAIVMLADSCEALVRASGEQGRQQLGDLVESIFAERLAEGQLDECDITMREIQTVSESFKATFRAMYHPRVAYPTPRPEELAILARAEPPSDGIEARGDPPVH